MLLSWHLMSTWKHLNVFWCLGIRCNCTTKINILEYSIWEPQTRISNISWGFSEILFLQSINGLKDAIAREQMNSVSGKMVYSILSKGLCVSSVESCCPFPPNTESSQGILFIRDNFRSWTVQRNSKVQNFAIGRPVKLNNGLVRAGSKKD